MKKLLLCTLIWVSSVYGIEIQCFSEAENIHTTIIKEDTSPRLFILFDDGENFLNYFQLDKNLIKVTEDHFSYSDEEMRIELFSSGQGLIESLSETILIGKKYRNLVVGKCNFLNVDL